MTTTYCTRNDIVSLIGAPALLATVDDNRNNQEDANEAQYITDAIERAAAEMNESLRHQYDLSALATANNAWLKWCNATLAAYRLFGRRGNQAPGSLVESVIDYRQKLVEMRWGREQIPEKLPDYDYTPTVSTMGIELNNPTGPVVVDTAMSTGPDPVGERKRNPANVW